MKLKIPAGLYDAMAKLQRHCEKHKNCSECCFNESPPTPDYNFCILRQMPEDWADFNLERVSNVIRPHNASEGSRK